MSKLLLREFQLLCPDNICDISLLTEQEKKLRSDGRMILSGILQRAGIKNGNGRIYKKEILAREDNNYQKLIKENRALGECVQEGSKILTKDGWKDFRNIRDDEYVYTMNMETKEIELQKIERKIEKKYVGKAYKIKNRALDIIVTPKHKFYLIDRYGKSLVLTAEEIFNNRTKYDHCHIPKRANWGREEEKDFVELNLKDVNILDKRLRKDLREKYTKSLIIDKDIWSKFIGIYLAEGDCGNRKLKHGKQNSKPGFYVKISQNKGDKANQIKELLEQFPKEIKWRIDERSDGKKLTFIVCDARIWEYVNELGNKYTKYIPNEIKMYEKRYLENILEWFNMGDGRKRKCHYDSVAMEVFSVSQKLIEDLQEISIKVGCGGIIHVEYPQKDRMIEGRVIKKENIKPLWFLHYSFVEGIYLNKKCFNMEEVDYDGNVYCVSTPNKTFYCQNNGKWFLSHNCDHPEKEIVELKNASHIILRTWWQNDDLWGTLKVLSTPAGKILESLVNDGVRVGISSRGLGSVRESREGTIVNDDFVLVAYDCVSENSVPGAFLNLQEAKMKINEVLTKADRIYRTLNSILVKK